MSCINNRSTVRSSGVSKWRLSRGNLDGCRFSFLSADQSGQSQFSSTVLTVDRTRLSQRLFTSFCFVIGLWLYLHSSFKSKQHFVAHKSRMRGESGMFPNHALSIVANSQHRSPYRSWPSKINHRKLHLVMIPWTSLVYHHTPRAGRFLFRLDACNLLTLRHEEVKRFHRHCQMTRFRHLLRLLRFGKMSLEMSEENIRIAWHLCRIYAPCGADWVTAVISMLHRMLIPHLLRPRVNLLDLLRQAFGRMVNLEPRAMHV